LFQPTTKKTLSLSSLISAKYGYNTPIPLVSFALGAVQGA